MLDTPRGNCYIIFCLELLSVAAGASLKKNNFGHCVYAMADALHCPQKMAVQVFLTRNGLQVSCATNLIFPCMYYFSGARY